jgi:hypothetical protein
MATTSYRSGAAAAMSSVWVPMEPVDPITATREITVQPVESPAGASSPWRGA